MVESVEAELAKHRLLNTVEIVGYRDRNDIYGLFSGGDYTLLFSDDCLDKEFENICINISDFKDYCYPGVMGDVDELWNQDVQKEIMDLINDIELNSKMKYLNIYDLKISKLEYDGELKYLNVKDVISNSAGFLLPLE